MDAEVSFDFDDWAALARRDRAAFERRRRRVIDGCIAAARNTHRLRRLQWRIDMERRRARTPLQACLRISGMMWDRVVAEGGLRDRLQARRPQPGTRPKAQVLPFPGRR